MNKKILSVITAISLMMTVVFTGSFFAKGDSGENAEKSFHVLTVGNSFSRNSMNYLYDIAKACGYTDIKVGYLYSGGRALDAHWSVANKQVLDGTSDDAGTADYTYWENSNGTWEMLYDHNANNGVASDKIIGDSDKKWNYVLLQQASELAGIDTYNNKSTYEPYVENLVAYVQALAPNATIGYNMVWADHENTERISTGKTGIIKKSYNGTDGNFSQLVMYEKICEMTQSHVANVAGIKFVVPTGTGVQNLRTSYYGDNLTDTTDYHLNTTGEFVAALTFFEAINKELGGKSITNYANEISSLNIVHPNHIPAFIEAASNAVINPYQRTASSYTVSPVETPVYDESLTYFGTAPGGYFSSTGYKEIFNAESNNLLSSSNATVTASDGTDVTETNTTTLTKLDNYTGDALSLASGKGKSDGLKLTYKIADEGEKVRLNKFAFVQGNAGYGLEASYELYIADSAVELYNPENKIYTYDATKTITETNKTAPWGQLITFVSNNPIGSYLGVKFTNTCTYATNNNSNVRLKGIGAWGEIKSENIAEVVAPIMESKTSDSVTLVARDGYEYSIGGMNWQDSPEFTGLFHGTEYVFYQRIKETADTFASVAQSAEFSTDKGTPAAPTAPTLKTQTANSVELDYDSSYEYSIDGVNFSDNALFKALNETKTYSFYRRTKESANENASAPSSPLVISLSNRTISGTEYRSESPSDIGWSNYQAHYNSEFGKLDKATPFADSLINGKTPVNNAENTRLTNATNDNNTDSTGAIAKGGYVIFDLGGRTRITKFALVQFNPFAGQEATYEVYVGDSEEADELIADNNLVFKHEPTFTGENKGTNPSGSVVQSIDFTEGNEPIGSYIAVKIVETMSNGNNQGNTYPREIGVWGNQLTEQSAPAAPTIKEQTKNSVTLDSIEGYEYTDGINGWVSSNVFEGLEAGKTYTFYQRKAETTNALASDASEALTVTIGVTGKPGDANFDGEVDICDLVHLNAYIKGQVGSISTDADLNGDGAFNNLDFVALRKLLLEK